LTTFDSRVSPNGAADQHRLLGFNFNVEEWDAEASQREARLGQIRLQYRSRDR
jgi:hypothetical protein